MNEKFLNALKIVYSKLENSGIKWILCGSTSFSLQGMDFEPRYLDVCIAYRDLEKARELFSEYELSDVKEIANSEAVDFTFDIDGVEVQICADYEHGIYYLEMKDENIIFIDLEDMKIPVLKLEIELKCYERIGGKQEKIKMIKEFITNR